jgi:hypothetical protein
MDEYLDVFEYVMAKKYPKLNVRALLLVDWCSGHAKMPDTAWNPVEMNLLSGGKGKAAQAVKRMAESITLLEDYPMKELNGQDMGYGFKKGDKQFLFFQPGESPWYDPQPVAQDAPDGMGVYQGNKYMGKAKGLKQLLWERELWAPGMAKDGTRTESGKRVDLGAELNGRCRPQGLPGHHGAEVGTGQGD